MPRLQGGMELNTEESHRLERQNGVDAIRGLLVFSMLCVNAPGDPHSVFVQMQHSYWKGYTATDIVFPGFLFVSGISIALSITSRLSQGETAITILKRQLARASLLVGAGLVLNAVPMWFFHLESFRLMGVLQRIALCSLLTGATFAWLGARGVWGLIVIALAAYSTILVLDDTYAPYVNLPDRIDAALLGTHAAWLDPATGLRRDPEGLMSTLGAIATMALGTAAAPMIRRHQTGRLLLFGLICVLTGYWMSLEIPLIKRIWTPSFALVSAGMAALLTCLGGPLGRVTSLRVLGRNALPVYMASMITFEAAFVTGLWTQIHTYFALAMETIARPRAVSALQSLGYAILWIAILRLFENAKRKRAIFRNGASHVP
jgi:predicted acyltransferase